MQDYQVLQLHRVNSFAQIIMINITLHRIGLQETKTNKSQHTESYRSANNYRHSS